MSLPAEFLPRSVCYECHKPQSLCVCGRVPRVDNRTAVTVLQHPRERLHAIGTARFARLGLARARVEVVWNAGTREERPPDWLPEGTALLYPAEGARDVRDLGPEESPEHVVVIDGTWHTARTLYRDKAWLQRLPKIRLSPDRPSRYRIRREPRRDFLSTIEAIVETLRILEPGTVGLDALLDAFDAMIDEQLVYIQRGSAVPRSRERRPREWRRTPRALIEDFDRLVVTYAESARPHPRGPRSIVHFAAVELSSGRALERLLALPQGLPTSTHLSHMRLTPRDFDGAVDLETFRVEWQKFLAGSQEPLVTAWNQSTLDLLGASMPEGVARATLKSAYRNVFGGGCGCLEDVVREANLAVGPPRFKGRAGSRIASALAVARHLNARALQNHAE
jgi:DTW domain-containing protein YfiP